MAAVVITDFKGVIPVLSEALRPPNVAATATNVELFGGDVWPSRVSLSVGTAFKGATVETLYRYKDTYWFNWTSDVDVAEGPIAGDTEDTVYFTGDGVPKMTYSSIATGGPDYPTTAYDLGVPAPTSAPTVAHTAETAVASGTISTITFARSDGADRYIPTITTTVAHGLKIGDVVRFDSIVGTTELNTGNYTIGGVPGTTTFTLKGVEEIPMTAYTSGGNWKQLYTDVNSTVYVYTYVTEKGEEGPPSPPSEVLDVPDGQVVDITGMLTGPVSGSYNILHKNIYRANTSDYGTDFQFVKQVTLATTSTTDALKRDELDYVMDCVDNEPPPSDMAGIIVLPNGVAAGFSGKTLYMSKPYTPHAWPTSYQHTVKHNIVGLGHFGTNIVILTEGPPYLASGYDPASTTIQDSEIQLACVSKRSIVSADNGVYYASNDGLVRIGPGGAQLVTADIMSTVDWQYYNPSTHIGAYRDGVYYFLDTNQYLYGLHIHRAGLGIVYYQNDSANTLYLHKKEDEIYFLSKSTSNIYKLFGGAGYRPKVYRTSYIQTPRRTSFGWARVEFNFTPLSTAEFRLYVDGVLKHTESGITGDKTFRLPAGFTADRWQVEIRDGMTVKRITLAETMNDLRGVP